MDESKKKTRPDTRHKMRLVCVLFAFKNNTGHADRRTYGRTDGRTDTTFYRDATAHLKMETTAIPPICIGDYFEGLAFSGFGGGDTIIGWDTFVGESGGESSSSSNSHCHKTIRTLS